MSSNDDIDWSGFRVIVLVCFAIAFALRFGWGLAAQVMP